ncbi:MFS transporter [Streptococcus ruminantium]|uniref:MFS transporter n=1 Tax=Streptococcus ruminantium TaxID=1917441 RepID=A0ABU1B303_9STRE|nr:MFS transporter [Streptococcus ruminantium]MDQ8758670.1 MFS transporter [Streptococcus ruminantium]MDQ8769089.1 MFS transporter [Streptococcus ruminantium]MDQ8774052.1 MFS transporter [Streptococcus ruminantium]MDQ8793082.1 MFS transporter [Streptococcus ruminantium]MDQ8795313.1 MFS transporter [Streptococcus ruminantium]
MKRILEKMSLLALSTMLVSTFAVSPAIPQMIEHFAKEGISAGQVENLVTITSFAIMVTLLLNGFIVRILSERAIIIIGLLLMATGGSMPVLFSAFPLVFLARILLGLGIGLINARAINIIGTFFTGKERVQMMGLRGSAEVLGSAGLTLLVGWLIQFGWQRAFMVYLFAMVILALFVLFVPQEEFAACSEIKLEEPGTKIKLDRYMWKLGIILAFLAFFVINVNTFLTIRIPQIVLEKGIGTAQQASLILSLMQVMGIVAGTLFGFLMGRLKGWLLAVSYAIYGLAVIGITVAGSLWLLGLGSMISGFFYSIILTIVFSQVADRVPKSLLNTVMTIVLMGCCTGGATSAILPIYLEKLNPTTTGAFGIYAIGCALISASLFYKQVQLRK